MTQLGDSTELSKVGSRQRTTKENLFRLGLVLLVLQFAGHAGLRAQSNTRLILSTGAGVPGHAGFVFGPFSGLAMNAQKEIVFLSTLRSARSEIKAVVRSSGVSFSVVAFQGLRSPVPKAVFDSFSAPSINDAGAIAFTATLKDTEEVPGSAVVRFDGTNFTALVTAGDVVPVTTEAKFAEFSAPLIDAQGNVLFGARWDGKKAGSGLFLWTPGGLHTLAMPAGLTLPSKTLLDPIFFSHDEAVFVPRDVPTATAVEQFFRVVATQSFQDLKPPPDLSQTFELLPAKVGARTIQMVPVLMEGGSAQTALLPGDPTQPVMARRTPGTVDKPLARIDGQTTGAQGRIVFAAASGDPPNDVGLFCYCDAQVVRLTSAEEFTSITQSAPGKPILSLAGDSQQTAAFIGASLAGGEGTGIYVTSLP